MSSWSDVAQAGEVIECPPARQTIEFLETGDDTDGEYLRVEITLAEDATRERAIEHVHPHQEETLIVLDGRLGIEWNGERQVLSAGETVTFEKGDAHAFWNAGDTELLIQFEIRPALQTELFMRFAFGLTQIGETTKSGIPLHPLRLGLLLDEFDGHLYLAGIPVWLQKIGGSVLGPLARLRGYTLDLDDGFERPALD
jgi:quercetin dioxygenase-like cupin family protein